MLFIGSICRTSDVGLGYNLMLAFKIKTKATLQVDDSFSNTAAIYFDFNHPIITNEAITTVTILDTPNFDFNAT